MVYNDEVKDSSGISVAGRVPRVASLDGWCGHDWSGGVHLFDLSAMHRLTVTTRNSIYDIVVVSPRTGQVMVRGGAFFPSFTAARLCGSSLGGGLLKLHVVHPGFCLELCHDEVGVVVTTPVRTVIAAAATSDHHETVM